jgi:hypothetical protein
MPLIAELNNLLILYYLELISLPLFSCYFFPFIHALTNKRFIFSKNTRATYHFGWRTISPVADIQFTWKLLIHVAGVHISLVRFENGFLRSISPPKGYPL